jgi:hypothetical protein
MVSPSENMPRLRDGLKTADEDSDESPIRFRHRIIDGRFRGNVLVCVVAIQSFNLSSFTPIWIARRQKPPMTAAFERLERGM